MDWRGYQQEVAQFFREWASSVTVEAVVKGARASHKVDVWVEFSRLGIPCKWVIECKLWQRNVPKEKVLALQSLVQDVGADRGLLISEVGFQPGALDAARDTNITLIPSFDIFKVTARTARETQDLLPSKSSSPLPLFTFPRLEQPHWAVPWNSLLFVGNWASSNVALVDPMRRTILDRIQLDHYDATRLPNVRASGPPRRSPPSSLVVAGSKLFVAQAFGEHVLAVDIETGAVVKRLQLGGDGELTASPDGRRVFFATNHPSSLHVIDATTYSYYTVPYPGRGIGALYYDAARDRLFLGVQRGGSLNGRTYFGGNCFVACFDVAMRRFISSTYLAEVINGISDDALPMAIIGEPDGSRLYVGLMQSRRGIVVLDGSSLEHVADYRFKPNADNRHFKWVDPLGLALAGDALLSVNRNNFELAVNRPGITGG